MRKTVKHLAIVFGILFIAFPFVSSAFLSQPNNQITRQPDNQISPSSPSTYIAQAQKLIENAHNAPDPVQTADYLRDALTAVNEGLIVYDNTAELYALRGEIYALLIDSVTDADLFALHDYSQAFNLAASETEYGRKAASIALANSEYDQAVQLLAQLHIALPDDPEILLDLAQAQAKAGNITDAIDSYSYLIALLPAGDTATIRKERDILVELATANLYDEDAGSVQTGEPSIGGVELIPPVVQTIPVEVTLNNSLTNDNPYKIGTNDGMTGGTILLAGRTHISISHAAVDANTPIYVTAISNTENQTLYVSNKSNGIFTVALDEPITNDVSFKYWIVN